MRPGFLRSVCFDQRYYLDELPSVHRLLDGVEVVLFTVYLYNLMKKPIMTITSNQAYGPTLVCLFTAWRLCNSKKRR